jgi:rhamnosyltransferase
MNAPLVSVVIPTRNAGAAFPRLHESLSAQQVPGGIEIVVIDSASTDGTSQRARKAGARVLSIPRRRFNHGRTRNQAIEVARGEFVALTVQDALPAGERWLEQLLAPLLEMADLAGSYGLQVAPPTAGLLARARSATWRSEHSQPTIKALADPMSERTAAERLELIRFDNVTSCVRRTAWSSWPFPERIYAEDMAWAKTVLLAGHRLAYVPEARVWHAHERRWLYELRRAYVDGLARAELADWPSPGLSFSEAWGLLRHVRDILLTRRFDSVATLERAREIMQQESENAAQRTPSTPTTIRLEALRFTLDLTTEAAALRGNGCFGTKEWVQLLRFAVVNAVGTSLGATAFAARGEWQQPERARWNMLHWFLGRGI